MNEKNEHQDETVKKPEKADAMNTEAMSDEELLAAFAEDEAQAGNVEDGEFSNPLEALAAENTRQEEEIKELKDKMLRTVAEMENLRRRTQKDVADARTFSISGFARDILGVADNLQRALQHVPEEEQQDPGLKTLKEGVELTGRELQNTLEKNGVKMIDPKGEKFDPNYHQAMFEVPNTEVPNATVMEVVQVGYVIGDRVLRPAMVGVSKGGPKASASSQPDETQG